MKPAYVVANGIRIHYVGEGEGPLLLLCHGFPECWYSWRHQISPLAGAGWRVVALDLPGYGLSDKPDVVYDVAWLNACLAGVIDGLGYERAVLAGHDWGGLLAWPFARMYPQKTAGVIGLNTPDLPRTPAPTVEYLRRRGQNRHNYILQFQERGAAESFAEGDIRGFLELFFKGPATVHKEVFDDDVMGVYVETFKAAGALTPPLEYYRNLDRNWELLEAYDGITIDVPCLMITAEGDPVLRPSLADGMSERVPNLTTVLIEDCGHWTQQEQPQETTRHMLAYLQGLRAG